MEDKPHIKEEECPVCLEDFNENKKQFFCPCGHGFCITCLKDIFQIKPYCPLCQTKVKEEFIHKVQTGEILDQYDQKNKQEQLKFQHQLYNIKESQELTKQPKISAKDWNVNMVRVMIGQADRNGMQNVKLSNGEKTNINIHKNVKINVSKNTNLRINGKQIQNPEQCSQQ